MADNPLGNSERGEDFWPLTVVCISVTTATLIRRRLLYHKAAPNSKQKNDDRQAANSVYTFHRKEAPKFNSG
jgi:hypothetical protein